MSRWLIKVNLLRYMFRAFPFMASSVRGFGPILTPVK